MHPTYGLDEGCLTFGLGMGVRLSGAFVSDLSDLAYRRSEGPVEDALPKINFFPSSVFLVFSC